MLGPKPCLSCLYPTDTGAYVRDDCPTQVRSARSVRDDCEAMGSRKGWSGQSSRAVAIVPDASSGTIKAAPLAAAQPLARRLAALELARIARNHGIEVEVGP